MHTFNPSGQEAEASGAQWVPVQPVLHSETMSEDIASSRPGRETKQQQNLKPVFMTLVVEIWLGSFSFPGKVIYSLLGLIVRSSEGRGCVYLSGRAVA